MPLDCDITLRWDATPAQLGALGTALWSWCARAAGNAGVYQYLDNQPLADVISGTFPVPGTASGRADAPGVRVSVKDGAFADRRAALDSLRRDLPTAAIAGVAVNDAGGRPNNSQEEPRAVTRPRAPRP